MLANTVAEPLVETISGDGAGEVVWGVRGGRGHRVQVARGVTSEDRRPGLQVLDRETK